MLLCICACSSCHNAKIKLSSILWKFCLYIILSVILSYCCSQIKLELIDTKTPTFPVVKAPKGSKLKTASLPNKVIRCSFVFNTHIFIWKQELKTLVVFIQTFQLVSSSQNKLVYLHKLVFIRAFSNIHIFIHGFIRMLIQQLMWQNLFRYVSGYDVIHAFTSRPDDSSLQTGVFFFHECVCVYVSP